MKNANLEVQDTLSYSSSISEKLEYLRTIGLRPFPLPSLKKAKPPNDFQIPSTPKENLHRYRDDHPKSHYRFYENSNIGISLSSFGHPDEELSLFILDVDVDFTTTPPKNGIPQFDVMKKKYNLPDTYAVTTPRGGIHYYYCVNSDLMKNIMQTVPKHLKPDDESSYNHIDTRSYGNYLVSPYSKVIDHNKEIDGIYVPISPYQKIEKLPTDFLKTLASQASKPNATSQSKVAPGVIIDSPANKDRAREVLFARNSQEDGERNHSFFQLALDIRKMGVSQSFATTLILEYNEKKCNPPEKNINEIESTVRSAYNYANVTTGSDSIMIDPHQAKHELAAKNKETNQPTITSAELTSSLTAIEPRDYIARTTSELSEVVFEIMTSKGPRYAFSILKPHLSPYTNRQILTNFLRLQDLKEYYYHVQEPYAPNDKRHATGVGKTKLMNLIEIAKLKGSFTRCTGMEFNPATPKIHNGMFNEWNGHTYSAFLKEEIESFTQAQTMHYEQVYSLIVTEYIHKILANNDKLKTEYILSWIAKRLSNPDWKPTVVMAFFGDRGTGKTFLTEKLLSNLIGKKYMMHYADIDKTKANFNSEIRTAQIISWEEMVNARAHKDRGVLKSFITATDQAVEEKFERRYFVAEVSSRRIQDRKFFCSILDILDSHNGIGWKYLYTILSNPLHITQDPDVALITKELRGQVKATLEYDDSIYMFLLTYNNNNKRLDADHDSRVIPADDALDDMTETQQEYFIAQQKYAWPEKDHTILTRYAYLNYKAYYKGHYTNNYNLKTYTMFRKYLKQEIRRGGIIEMVLSKSGVLITGKNMFSSGLHYGERSDQYTCKSRQETLDLLDRVVLV